MGRVAGGIERAVEILRNGGLVAFPTETVYGLGADARNPRAVRRIFQVKGRPPTHPLIVHIAEPEDLYQWAVGIPEVAWRLADRFWPGPLSLVLRRSSLTPPEVTGGQETVAVRVPSHPVARDLLRAFGSGVAAPSANRFQGVSPTTADHVRDSLGRDVDIVLDGGPCPVGLESTILDLTGDEPAVLRPGGIPLEDLRGILGSLSPTGTERKVRAPGQHPLHYAPRARVTLVEDRALIPTALRLQGDGHRVGLLLPHHVPPSPEFSGPVIRLPERADGIARMLYSALRDLDRAGCGVIVASLPPAHGLGLAIADRLHRAAGPREGPGAID